VERISSNGSVIGETKFIHNVENPRTALDRFIELEIQMGSMVEGDAFGDLSLQMNTTVLELLQYMPLLAGAAQSRDEDMSLLEVNPLVLTKDGELNVNLEDDIVAACLMTQNGTVLRK
jgi:hypothetical protein